MYQIKPRDVEIDLWQWFGTDFSSEFETVAENVILILTEGDEWREISWKEYKDFIEQNNDEVDWEDEIESLEEIINQGFLNYRKGKFTVDESFIETISGFVR